MAIVDDWGRTRYAEALSRQLSFVEQRRCGERTDTLVLTEHYPVYTVGKRKGASNHLIADERFLREQGIEVVETNRGGDITYHGPGQITGYLITDLSRSRDLHRLLRTVEDMLIDLVGQYGLAAGRRQGMTGVWIENRKIAAIGMAARHWVSFHGFALNVSTELSHFSGIVPCGITDGSVTSLQAELALAPDLDAVKDQLSVAFRERFPA